MNVRRTLTTAVAALAASCCPLMLAWAQAPKRPAIGQPAGPRPPQKDFSNAPRFQVFRIIDGSTVAVILNAQPVPVHLLGVELPPVKPSVRKQGADQASRESAEFLRKQVLDQAVFLDFEPGRPQRDEQGRILAYVYRAADGALINQELIAAGHGRFVATEAPSVAALLRTAEQSAKQKQLGIWAGAPAQDDPAGAKAGSNPAQKVAAEGAEEPADDQVYVAKGSTRYHRAGCSKLGKNSTALSLAEAKKKHTPCPVCKPNSTKASAKSGTSETTAKAKPKKRRYQSQAAQREALNRALEQFDPGAYGGGGPGVPPY